MSVGSRHVKNLLGELNLLQMIFFLLLVLIPEEFPSFRYQQVGNLGEFTWC